MAKTKKTAPVKVKVTNLDRLDTLVRLAKANKTNTVEYKKVFSHLQRVLAPVQKGEIIKQILELHKAGFSNKEIADKGYNKVTVSRQVKEFKTKTTYAISYANQEDVEEE
jgi:uncharacterized tellurite resistance protein B-like protein